MSSSFSRAASSQAFLISSSFRRILSETSGAILFCSCQSCMSFSSSALRAASAALRASASSLACCASRALRARFSFSLNMLSGICTSSISRILRLPLSSSASAAASACSAGSASEPCVSGAFCVSSPPSLLSSEAGFSSCSLSFSRSSSLKATVEEMSSVEERSSSNSSSEDEPAASLRRRRLKKNKEPASVRAMIPTPRSIHIMGPCGIKALDVSVSAANRRSSMAARLSEFSMLMDRT